MLCTVVALNVIHDIRHTEWVTACHSSTVGRDQRAQGISDSLMERPDGGPVSIDCWNQNQVLREERGKR